MDDSKSRPGRSRSPSDSSTPRTKRICSKNIPYYDDSEEDGDFSCTEIDDTTWKPSDLEDFEQSDLEDFDQSTVSNQSHNHSIDISMEIINDSHDERSNTAVTDNNTIEINDNEQAVIMEPNGEFHIA